MLRILGPGARLCDGWNRREAMRIGGLGAISGGLALSDLLKTPAKGAGPSTTASSSGFGKAKSCIILFLMGGPPQHSTWDPKPDAPAEVRGDFGPISTAVPGISICSLFPRTARITDKISILRAMSTGDNAHSSSGYYMLTGHPHAPMNFENANPGPPNDSPSLGAMLGIINRSTSSLPPTITVPHRISNTDGSVWPGQDAGLLGRSSDPWLLNAQLLPEGYKIKEIDLPADLDSSRVKRRHDLLDHFRRSVDRLEDASLTGAFDTQTRKAFDLLSSPASRKAFRLEDEPEVNRKHYGETPFGQSVLLARRLIESGVKLVQVNWYRGPDEPPANPCWDSHTDESNRLKDVLATPTDWAFSALVEDLDQRGMLDETLVVCMAEFGRSPRLDKTSGGRNHWGSVFSIALAGGGVRGGHVHGASDRIGAYPVEGLVKPEDLAATIFHCLGHAPDTEYLDPLGRPHAITRGDVIRAIL